MEGQQLATGKAKKGGGEMKLKWAVILAVFGLLLGSAYSFADQIIVLDPVSSYEFYYNDPALFTIPIGATFFTAVSSQGDYDLYVQGLPASGIRLEIRKVSPFRIEGTLYKMGPIQPGEYNISITARQHSTAATTSATMKLKIVNAAPNASIIFDPLEQIKVLKVNQWYSIAIAVTDLDSPELLLDVTGAANNAIGYAAFKITEVTPGRTGGVLNLKMARPGELKINLCGREHSPEPGRGNTSIAELHFLAVP
ncbi:MAG: hypothetical protein AB1481_01915 [Candidatus Omnitrophota bacterium]